MGRTDPAVVGMREKRFDPADHTFCSPKFASVVAEAVSFLARTPVLRLPPQEAFTGCGVYALYYRGRSRLYAAISQKNRTRCVQPIYVGKAVPPGWRAARAGEEEQETLYGRLREHTRSIEQGRGLQPTGFRCRFVILRHREADLIVPIEAELIRRHKPLWNQHIDGFGNHDPGSGRYDQAHSEWDVLHPGRPWVKKLKGKGPSRREVVKKVQKHAE